ncbi:spore germination protein GerPC [Priestia koreensis]|uniref:Spore gernimation protein n=1 Tax=Priestia koreensis TaxID=284581 RepID=A0A0M0LH05_9BACI|nr:spore germination protein GerPC [Priestia koreensis]KOO50256.1 spore gernimation protein [Priestia koreensis]
MDYLQHLYQYIQQVSNYIQHQTERIQQLEASVQELQDKVKELDEKPATKIDKIEYKFEQLKIDTLDGTLNIGLNPLTPDNMEDFIINSNTTPSAGQDLNVPPVNPTLYPVENRSIPSELVEEIHAQILADLEEHGESVITSILTERQFQIDYSYYEFIIEDIKKQLEPRIIYHLQQLDARMIAENREAVREDVLSKLVEDIKKGINAFLTYLPESLKSEGGPT